MNVIYFLSKLVIKGILQCNKQQLVHDHGKTYQTHDWKGEKGQGTSNVNL